MLDVSGDAVVKRRARGGGDGPDWRNVFTRATSMPGHAARRGNGRRSTAPWASGAAASKWARRLTASRVRRERAGSRSLRTVSVKDVDIALDSPSRVGAIIAESVRVRRPSPGFLGPTPSLEVERIDANLVELEAVHVECCGPPGSSRGKKCRDRLMRRTVVRKHASARLGPSSVSAPP